MINVELPCRIEERISAKTNKPYMVAIVTVTEDYEMELFINTFLATMVFVFCF